MSGVFSTILGYVVILFQLYMEPEKGSKTNQTEINLQGLEPF